MSPVSAILNLIDLTSDFPHIPPACGESLAQAIAVSLKSQGHTSGTVLKINGLFKKTFAICWTVSVTEAVLRYWNDPDEAVEQAACGIAILLMRSLTGYTVIERARRGTGFDWWLGSEDDLFQAKARLEVSGILRGTPRRLNSRVKEKLEQTRRSDQSTLPAYVVVIEFGAPQGRVVLR